MKKLKKKGYFEKNGVAVAWSKDGKLLASGAMGFDAFGKPNKNAKHLLVFGITYYGKSDKKFIKAFKKAIKKSNRQYKIEEDN